MNESSNKKSSAKSSDEFAVEGNQFMNMDILYNQIINQSI
jgi:hypothetical protein